MTWIFGTSNLDYKDKLLKADLLPLSLYHELHVILLLQKSLKERWTLHGPTMCLFQTMETPEHEAHEILLQNMT